MQLILFLYSYHGLGVNLPWAKITCKQKFLAAKIIRTGKFLRLSEEVCSLYVASSPGLPLDALPAINCEAGWKASVEFLTQTHPSRGIFAAAFFPAVNARSFSNSW